METCTNCGAQMTFELRNYQYTESGLSNVVLQDVEVPRCSACGSEDLILPFPEKIHWAIAHALVAENPARMTGEQLRFLRKHMGFSGDGSPGISEPTRLRSRNGKHGEDPIGKSTDRLVRLLAAERDPELKPAAGACGAFSAYYGAVRQRLRTARRCDDPAHRVPGGEPGRIAFLCLFRGRSRVGRRSK